MITLANTYSENINIKYSEMDYNLVLKPSALLNFLQDMASANAEQLDFGYSAIVKKNLAWFLLKYRLEFSEYPQNLYNLTLTTEPRGYNRLFAYRDFGLYDGEKQLGKVSSIWSLVDLDNKKLANIQTALDSPAMKPYEKREDDLIFDKIPAIENPNIEKKFEIRFDDLDVNRHVNNCNYIIWAFEPLSFDFRSTKRLKTLDIAYKKEVKYGDEILSQIQIVNNTTIHNIKNLTTGEDLCSMKAEWI